MIKSRIWLSVLLVAGLVSACELGLGGDPAGPEVVECAAVTEIPEAECKALAALYHDTDGGNWTDRTGWLETNAPCSWFGVICSGGQVVQVHLSSNELAGPIPAELGNLAALSDLRLGNNQLSGPIPAELGNLTSLVRLRLGRNQLTGLVPLPVADFGGKIQESIFLTSCSFASNEALFMPDSQNYMDADLDGDGFICGVPVGELLPSAISLVTIDLPVGTTLLAGQVISFTATVSYELNNAASGEIRMFIQHQTLASLQSGPRPVVEIAGGSGTVTLSDQVTIPATAVPQISVILALFSAGQGTTNITASASYPVQPPVSVSGRLPGSGAGD